MKTIFRPIPFRLAPARFVTLGLGVVLSSSLLLVVAQAKPRARVKVPSKAAKPNVKAASLRWTKSFAAGVAQARRSKRPVFIDFSTDWCSACRVLEGTTFRDPKFIAASRGWVLVSINPEKGATNARLGQMYGVTSFPTLVLADSAGKIVNKLEGAYPTHMLLPQMNAAVRQLKSERMAASR